MLPAGEKRIGESEDSLFRAEAAARWIALSRLPKMSPARLGGVFRRFGSSEAAFSAWAGQFSQAASNRELESLLRQLGEFSAQGIQAVPIESALYPRGLLDLRTPPVVLFVSGELQPGDARAIAIVGTRTPSAKGLQAAREVARRAAAAGFCVVSGLARGIDTAAHRSALLATGRTIAIVGNGLLNTYPPENRILAARIRRRGVVISELWPEEQVCRRNLLARDRLQAAMSLAVVVVQSHLGCGSLTTARYAISCRRPLFVLRWEEEPFSIGLARLRQIGANVIDLDDLDEVFRAAEAGGPEGLFSLPSE